MAMIRRTKASLRGPFAGLGTLHSRFQTPEPFAGPFIAGTVLGRFLIQPGHGLLEFPGRQGCGSGVAFELTFQIAPTRVAFQQAFFRRGRQQRQPRRCRFQLGQPLANLGGEIRAPAHEIFRRFVNFPSELFDQGRQGSGQALNFLQPIVRRRQTIRAGANGWSKGTRCFPAI